jgi:hypothetical protein
MMNDRYSGLRVSQDADNRCGVYDSYKLMAAIHIKSGCAVFIELSAITLYMKA